MEQRNAQLAGSVKLEFVNGREGKIAKATLTAISNARRGSGEGREEVATAILWTLWGKQAYNFQFAPPSTWARQPRQHRRPPAQ